MLGGLVGVAGGLIAGVGDGATVAGIGVAVALTPSVPGVQATALATRNDAIIQPIRLDLFMRIASPCHQVGVGQMP